jgi:hypothetical protein
MRVVGMPAGKDSNPLAARGRILMPVPALAGGFCCPYPCPSGRVSADTRARGQNCHPYPCGCPRQQCRHWRGAPLHGGCDVGSPQPLVRGPLRHGRRRQSYEHRCRSPPSLHLNSIASTLSTPPPPPPLPSLSPRFP